MPDTTPDPAEVRAAARAAIGVPGDAPVRWRYVTIEYGGAIAPVCTATSYTGISETHATHTLDDGSRDDTGIYDCCPYPHIEVWSDELAAYLVALLNADADAGRPPMGTLTINPDPRHVAADIRDVRRAGGLPRYRKES